MLLWSVSTDPRIFIAVTDYTTEKQEKGIHMKFLIIYAGIIRAALLIFTAYYSFRRDFKKAASAVIALVLSFVPFFLEKAFMLRADIFGNILYYAVIVMSLFLGSGLKFYDKYSWWDQILHFMCGVMFVSFGIPLAFKMGITNIIGILFFCFTLSTTLHALWEAAEYAADSLAHTDHQRWQKRTPSRHHKSPGTAQPSGLADTMNDIIICMAGTLAACIVQWFILK